VSTPALRFCDEGLTHLVEIPELQSLVQLLDYLDWIRNQRLVGYCGEPVLGKAAGG
jgi:hypothetical protein